MTSLRTLGSSDLQVFPLALGGNVFGWTADEDRSFAVLDAYVAAGGNFIDTADSYSAWVPGNRAASRRPSSASGWRPAATATTSSSPPRSASTPSTRACPPRTHQGGGRGVAAPAGHRPHRPLLHALRRPERAGRGDHHRARPAGEGGQGAAHRRLQHQPRAARRPPWTSPSARASPATSRSSRTTTWSRATPTRARSRTSAAASGLAAVPYFALASGFLTGKYRPGATVDSAAGRAARPSTWRPSAAGKVLAALDEDRRGARRRDRHRRPRLAGRAADRGRADRLRAHGRAAAGAAGGGGPAADGRGDGAADRGVRLRDPAAARLPPRPGCVGPA